MFPETDLREQAMSCADATTQAFGRLAVNDGFVFAADRAPVPLRYLVEAERPGSSPGNRSPRMTTGSGGYGSAAFRPHPAQAWRD